MKEIEMTEKRRRKAIESLKANYEWGVLQETSEILYEMIQMNVPGAHETWEIITDAMFEYDDE